MVKKSFIYLFAGVMFLCSCSHPETPLSMTPQTDSVSREVTDWLLKSDLTRAMAVVDSADAAGLLSEFDAEMFRLRIISRDEGRLAEAVSRYEALLEKGVPLIRQLDVLNALIYLSRMPKPDRLPGYVDFYTGQAYAFLTFAYAALGQLDEARAYDRLHSQTNYSRTYGGRKQMASAWYMLGEYDRMNAIYDEMVAAMREDTVNKDYGLMLFNRAQVAAKQGKPALSANYWKRYAFLLQKLYDKERLAAAEESAARFHEQEQQYALEKEQARHKRDRIILISLSVVAVLISIVAFLIFYQWRIMRRKNALLSKEIAENIDYKMRYFEMSDSEHTSEVKDGESVPDLSAMSNAELFEFLHVVIIREQLFLNPYFERKSLTDRFGLSKERIGAAFSHGSRYASLADYVNECRLSYSTLLLSTRPDMSIADVASASGFSSASVFTRNFKQRYTMTPTEFRKKEN